MILYFRPIEKDNLPMTKLKAPTIVVHIGFPSKSIKNVHDCCANNTADPSFNGLQWTYEGFVFPMMVFRRIDFRKREGWFGVQYGSMPRKLAATLLVTLVNPTSQERGLWCPTEACYWYYRSSFNSRHA